MHEDRWLSVDEVAAYLGFRSRTTVYRKMELDGLPYEQIGSRRRLRRTAVDRWVRRQSSAAKAPR